MKKVNTIKPDKKVEVCPFCGNTIKERYDTWMDDSGEQQHNTSFDCSCGVCVNIRKPLEQAIEIWNLRNGYKLPYSFKDIARIVWHEEWNDEVNQWGYANNYNYDWIDKNRALKMMIDSSKQISEK